MKHHGMRAVLLVCAGLGTHSAPAHARPAPAPVQVIAQRRTEAPGEGGNFGSFINLSFDSPPELKNLSPSISGNNVAFAATTRDPGGSGMFALIDGQLRVVADTWTKIPGTDLTFGFSIGDGVGPNICGSTVVFTGINISHGSAIWLWRDGVLEKVVDSDTLVPGRSVTFGSFAGTPGISGDNVVFNARYTGGGGIYAVINGELLTIADSDTLLPGAPTTAGGFGFLVGYSAFISGENVVFWAGSGVNHRGIYLFANGVIRVIIDPNTPKPGGGGETFDFVPVRANFWPGISGENVAFSLWTELYAYINGTLRLVADDTTQAPGGGTFTTFSARTSIDGENIAFAAGTGGGSAGIFSYINGEFRTIASDNTPAPGFATNFSAIGFRISDGGGPGISGEQVVFTAGPPGVYTGDGIPPPPPPPPIPTVSTWGVIAMTLLLLTAGSIAVNRRGTAA